MQQLSNPNFLKCHSVKKGVTEQWKCSKLYTRAVTKPWHPPEEKGEKNRVEQRST